MKSGIRIENGKLVDPDAEDRAPDRGGVPRLVIAVVVIAAVGLWLGMQFASGPADPAEAIEEFRPAFTEKLARAAEASRPELGETIALGKDSFCMDTREGLDEAAKWLGRGDREEAALRMLRHGGGFTKAGDRVKVLDRALVGATKVRLLETGRECWMLSEFVTAAR